MCVRGCSRLKPYAATGINVSSAYSTRHTSTLMIRTEVLINSLSFMKKNTEP